MSGTAITVEELMQRRAHFESDLAIAIAGSGTIDAVTKVSETILTQLRDNRATVLRIIRDKPRVFDELYNTEKMLFGQSDASSISRNNPKDIYDDILEKLGNSETPLYEIMHIHVAFINQIGQALPEQSSADRKSAMKDLQKVLFPGSMFDKSRRVESNPEPMPSRILGIARSDEHTQEAKADVRPHIAARDRFSPPPRGASPDYERQLTHAMPFVAGISGHTGGLMFNALWVHEIDGDKAQFLKEYTMATAAYLIAGGNHSFDEVAKAASFGGLPYEDGHYASVIPDSLKHTFETVVANHPPEVSAPFSSAAGAGAGRAPMPERTLDSEKGSTAPDKHEGPITPSAG